MASFNFLKNITRVEITITISTTILVKYEKNSALIFVQFSSLIVIIISTRVVFLRKRRDLLKFLTKTWNKEN